MIRTFWQLICGGRRRSSPRPPVERPRRRAADAEQLDGLGEHLVGTWRARRAHDVAPLEHARPPRSAGWRWRR